MDFNAFLAALQDTTEVFTTYDVVLTIVLSFVLSLLIGTVYRQTHRGVAYSQSYVQTVVLDSPGGALDDGFGRRIDLLDELLHPGRLRRLDREIQLFRLGEESGLYPASPLPLFAY